MSEVSWLYLDLEDLIDICHCGEFKERDGE